MQKSLSNIDESYIKQLVACIQKGNMKHTEDVLSLFPAIDLQTRTRSLFEISMAKNDEAYQMFDFLVHSNTLPADTRSTLVELLLDKARNDSKFILLFIENADTHQLQEAVSVFANILVTETDPHILHETIKAVGLTGKKSCINVVADFIFYDHAELKQAAVNALGNIGGPSAIKRLAFASSTTKTDPLIEKTLENLQAELSIETQIEETTEQFASKKDTLEGMANDSDIAQLLKMFNSSSPHDRHTAIDLLIETGAHAVPAVSEAIDTSDPDSIINGLDVLGNIRNEIALPHILKILNIHHKDSNVRFAAYEAISKLPPVKSTVSLIEGLEDSSEQVRLAAATAINNNLSEVLVAGLRSKIETSGRQSKRKQISTAILDSHSGNIFSSLLSSDSFVFLASDYLASSHHTTASFFIDILKRRGSRSLAIKIQEGIKDTEKDNQLAIYVVDDSEITLKYYLKFFHNMGHLAITFDNPEDAVEAVKESKPDLITSDLNMLSMNGLQLTAKIRSMYDSTELPVAIITTQSDFVKSSTASGASIPDSDISRSTLINLVLKKPLTPKSIKPLLDNIINARSK